MAERRMFSKTVTGSDAFLELPMSARLLYYELAMQADDDGFVDGPKKVMRIVGASPADLDALTESRFLIPFENGTVVIRHWKAHNYIQKDRYRETVYLREKAMLRVAANNAYELREPPAATPCIHSVSNLDTEVRIEQETESEQEKETAPKREKAPEVDPSIPISPSSSAPDNGIALPTNEQKKQYVVGDETIREYGSLWPELDVRSEILAMRSWLSANPSRRKSPEETPRFVNGWLTRAHEKARAAPEPPKLPPAGRAASPCAQTGFAGTARHTRPASYDLQKAMEEMMTTVPKLKKREKG